MSRIFKQAKSIVDISRIQDRLKFKRAFIMIASFKGTYEDVGKVGAKGRSHGDPIQLVPELPIKNEVVMFHSRHYLQSQLTIIVE